MNWPEALVLTALIVCIGPIAIGVGIGLFAAALDRWDSR